MNTNAPAGAATAAPELHWSFNQNDANQPDFGAELVTILRTRRTGVAVGGSVTYRVLPNFWRGYRYEPAPGSLANGSIEIGAAPADSGDLVEYRVTSRNATSGEHATYSFRTQADRWRSIVGGWQIDVRNGAGDRYRSYRAAGSLTNVDAGCRAIVLAVGGAQVEAGRWSGAAPLTSLWTLTETIPALHDRCEVAILEDLERVREPAHVVPIGTWRWPPPHADLGTFTGWCVHGPGLMPTYYWVDDSGTVAVVSGLFQTWVRA